MKAIVTAGVLLAGCDGGGSTSDRNREHCGVISTDETWSVGTHLVSCDVEITGGTVTVHAGAEVLFTDGTSIEVTGGSLRAVGSPKAEVLFQGEVDSPGAWEGLFFRAGAAPDNVLAAARLRNAGQSNDADRPAALTVTGASVDVTQLTIESNAGLGFSLRDDGRFGPASEALIVTANAATGEAYGDSVATLPADAELFGNLSDTLEVSGTVTETGTWLGSAAGTYVVTGDITVEGDENPVLTIGAGGVLQFTDDALVVGRDGPGALVVAGTDEEPVVFTSLAGTPGAWAGIALEANTIAGLTLLEHLEVGFGGSYFGGIYVNDGAPIIDAAYLHDNAGCGLYVEFEAAPILGGLTFDNNVEGDLCDQ